MFVERKDSQPVGKAQLNILSAVLSRDRYRFYNLLLDIPIKTIKKLPEPNTILVVNPEPVPPTNCCMSGCAYCVWDIYQEELDIYERKSGNGSGQ